MRNLIVGISDIKMSTSPEDVIVTYALGSCVGVAIYDPGARVGGMIHCMLPLSKMDLAKAQANPCMFVDTGIPALFEASYRLGARKDRIIVKVAGGSSILDENGIFKIGERNYTIVRKIFWKNNVLISGEDVGGALSRTMYLEMETGRVSIRSSGQIRDL